MIGLKAFYDHENEYDMLTPEYLLSAVRYFWQNNDVQVLLDAARGMVRDHVDDLCLLYDLGNLRAVLGVNKQRKMTFVLRSTSLIRIMQNACKRHHRAFR